MSTTSTSFPSIPLPDLLRKFSHLPYADIILRSSDSHDFLVQKLYVVDSSLPVGLNMQGADVVLRSSDLVCFHVHKLVLTISSPFFNDMFSLPQPRDDEVIDGLPVVYMSEDAEVMHSLLTVLYFIPSMLPDSYEKTLDLLSASQK